MFIPRLTVITVVFNNVHDIARTLNSVISQTYSNIEYIVIDGASTDGTFEILKQYKKQISLLVSEPDNGIYDAMNKGLGLATGDYVLFMNSGDELFDKDTIANVFATADNADIYYGETEIINAEGESLGRRRHKVPKNFTWRSFKFGMSISHQAIFIKRLLTGPYDVENYKLSADIDWILKAAKKATYIINVNRYVAKYLEGGMSKKKHRQSLIERFNIMRHHYGLLPTILNHGVIAFNLGWYWLLHRRTND